MKREILSESSTGNVFADLCLPDAEVMLAKNLLAGAISTKIKEENLTQRQLAKNAGVTESRISKICGYQTDDVSLEAMLKILAAMDYDVVIDVQKRREPKVAYASLPEAKPTAPPSKLRQAPRALNRKSVRTRRKQVLV